MKATLIGLASVPPLVLLTISLEEGQIAQAAAGGWPFLAAVLFSAVVVSLLSHTIYYGLILRNPANLIAPLMVLSPLLTVGLGIAITRDPFDLRIGAGTTLALLGVLLVSVRGSPKAWVRAWLQKVGR